MYATGIANSRTDLMDKIRAFAVSLGWTVNDWGDRLDTNNTVVGRDLCLALGANYANLYTETSGDAIKINSSVGYDSTLDATNQAIKSGDCVSNHMTPGPYVAYHLFGGAGFVHCVVEVTAGEFKHIVFGTLEKTGAYTGGQYCGAVGWDYNSSYANQPQNYYHNLIFDYDHQTRGSFLRADIDGQSNQFLDIQRYNAAGTVRGGPGQWLYDRSPNTFNALTPVLPIYVYLPRPSGNWSLAGSPPDIRYVNMRYLQPGDEIALGPDTWKVFPALTRTDDFGHSGTQYPPSSGHIGYAYKKVTT